MKKDARSDPAASDAERHGFYRTVLEDLKACGTLFLIGGGYALEKHAGISRDSKDLDVLVRLADAPIVMARLRDRGYQAELSFPHWLGKVVGQKYFVDVIFSSGNGVCEVDSTWFQHAVPGQVLGVEVNFCAAEELIWSKGFVMERERFDGADIAHIIRARGGALDWRRLLGRFDAHWEVLLSHLLLFDFIYPSERANVPTWLVRELFDRLQSQKGEPPSRNRLCRGTLLSRSQYRADVEIWGYQDARQLPCGSMTPQDAAAWSAAADNPNDPKKGPIRD